ncbi:MAG TPA: GTPase Era [Methylomirabilota bacterium]|nr:GTPase Era [Methylomirabilota bacterium]
MSAPPPASTSSPDHRSGFVAIVGRPNVGKSTLLNRLLGQKIAIVSPKPQTTRNRITGIRSRPDSQIVYVDTPGLHPSRGKLGEFMAAIAAQALEEVDAVVFVTEATAGGVALDESALAALAEVEAPVLLALNKVDLVADKRRILPLLEAYAARYPFRELIPLSASRGEGVDRLERAILALLPAGPAFYPPDQLTDQPETFFVAETIREQLFLLTHQEVPYAAAVRVEELVEREGGSRLYIRAVIFVEQPSQKAIVIGEGGAMLKRIGQAARRELEAFFGVPVYLDLWVQVRRHWRRNEAALREFGYRLTS